MLWTRGRVKHSALLSLRAKSIPTEGGHAIPRRGYRQRLLGGKGSHDHAASSRDANEADEPAMTEAALH